MAAGTGSLVSSFRALVKALSEQTHAIGSPRHALEKQFIRLEATSWRLRKGVIIETNAVALWGMCAQGMAEYSRH